MSVHEFGTERRLYFMVLNNELLTHLALMFPQFSKR